MTLTDKEGLTLDTLSQPFSVINVSNITTTNFSNNFIFFNFLKNVLLIITIVLSLLGIIYFRKKYKESEKILN